MRHVWTLKFKSYCIVEMSPGIYRRCFYGWYTRFDISQINLEIRQYVVFILQYWFKWIFLLDFSTSQIVKLIQCCCYGNWFFYGFGASNFVLIAWGLGMHSIYGPSRLIFDSLQKNWHCSQTQFPLHATI